MKTLQPDIASHFGDLKDPRVEGKNQHLLIDIIIIAICAVVSGASGLVGSKLKFLEKPSRSGSLLF